MSHGFHSHHFASILFSKWVFDAAVIWFGINWTRWEFKSAGLIRFYIVWFYEFTFDWVDLTGPLRETNLRTIENCGFAQILNQLSHSNSASICFHLFKFCSFIWKFTWKRHWFDVQSYTINDWCVWRNSAFTIKIF